LYITGGREITLFKCSEEKMSKAREATLKHQTEIASSQHNLYCFKLIIIIMAFFNVDTERIYVMTISTYNNN